MQSIIDTHLHIWNLQRVYYHWISPGDVLYRDYLPDDVYPQMQASGVESAVIVEAANSADEIGFLVEQTEHHSWIRGIVGGASPEGKPHPKLRGLRISHLDSADISVLPNVITDHFLTCDLLLSPNTYSKALGLARAWPDITFVLDHFAGTRLTPDGHRTWREQVRPLANCPNLVVKISGYLTAAHPRPLSLDTFEAYLTTALELFGANRLMWGSDWPVCTQAGTYAQTVELLRSGIEAFTTEEQKLIMSDSAQRVYTV
jgi:L-fuconolactonase